VQSITVNGALSFGAPTCPLASPITVTIPGGSAAYGIDVAAGGRLDVHGTVVGPTWTRVAQTVPASKAGTPSRTIQLQVRGATAAASSAGRTLESGAPPLVATKKPVALASPLNPLAPPPLPPPPPPQDAVSWAAGQVIVLVTTYWRDEELNQNEVDGALTQRGRGAIHSPGGSLHAGACARLPKAPSQPNQRLPRPHQQVLTIASVTNGGRTVAVTSDIQYQHYGGEYQAEVALLSRNILFTSDATSTSTRLGPHTTSLSPDVRVVGAAYTKWGARNQPGKYPGARAARRTGAWTCAWLGLWGPR
jgi:hypothetical protein